MPLLDTDQRRAEGVLPLHPELPLAPSSARQLLHLSALPAAARPDECRSACMPERLSGWPHDTLFA